MVYIVLVHPQLSHNLFSMVVHWWMLGHIILDDVELNVSTPQCKHTDSILNKS
jgi:hypothetical protein